MHTLDEACRVTSKVLIWFLQQISDNHHALTAISQSLPFCAFLEKSPMEFIKFPSFWVWIDQSCLSLRTQALHPWTWIKAHAPPRSCPSFSACVSLYCLGWTPQVWFLLLSGPVSDKLLYTSFSGGRFPSHCSPSRMLCLILKSLNNISLLNKVEAKPFTPCILSPAAHVCFCLALSGFRPTPKAGGPEQVFNQLPLWKTSHWYQRIS